MGRTMLAISGSFTRLATFRLLIAADMQIVCKHPITDLLIKDYHYKESSM